ncbi:MAG: hypothetical protein C4297_10440 [Gemmataceae bacterium]
MAKASASAAAWWAGLILAGLAGCHTTHPWCVDNCSDVPPGALPAPAGTYVREFQNVQAGKAEMDDFVIYKHEWYMGGKDLGPYGLYHLDQIARRLPEVPFPVMIQAHADPELNEARRQTVIAQLAMRGIQDAQERVVVGYPAAEGLYGEEAEWMYEQMIAPRPWFPFYWTYGRQGFFDRFRSYWPSWRPWSF